MRAPFLQRALKAIVRVIAGSRRAEGYPGRGLWRRPKPMRRAEVDSNRCRGCGTCVSLCYYRRIRLRNGRARVVSGCQGCGACARECPEGAIVMVRR